MAPKEEPRVETPAAEGGPVASDSEAPAATAPAPAPAASAPGAAQE
jgi:hypothetical protein